MTIMITIIIIILIIINFIYVPFHEYGKVIPTPSALNVNSQA